MSSGPGSTALGDLTETLQSSESPQDEAFAKLERENAALLDAVKEERFCWILLCTILFDTAIFANVATTGVPLAILGLELIFIVLLARKLGVQQVVIFVDRVIDGLVKRSGSSDT